MGIVIHPIKLQGNWDLGYALDQHAISSTYLGDDAFGNQRYDTKRTEIGEFLYQIKYRHHHEYIEEVAEVLKEFIEQNPGFQDVGSIIPVPPTSVRGTQPTFEICEALSRRLDIYYCDDILEKNSSVASKGLNPEEKQAIQGTIVKKKNAIRKHNVLLIDDVYDTGTTLQECTRVLKEDPNIEKVFVIAITKTKNGDSKKRYMR